MNAIKTINILILEFCARVILGVYNPKIVVITGTAGKTTVKNVIADLLIFGLGKNKIRAGYGNLNTRSGIPLSILNIKTHDIKPYYWIWLTPYTLLKTVLLLLRFSYPKILILEMAADKPGDFDPILDYVKPDVSVITNIGAGHTQFFGNLENVFLEKSKIAKKTDKNGLVILNGNDSFAKRAGESAKAKVIKIDQKGDEFALAVASKIALFFGISQTKIESGLPHLNFNSKGRFNVIRGKKDTIIIDSSYNANPVSIAHDIDKLNLIAKARKIVILGDMLELGDKTVELHKQIGVSVKENANYFVGVGDLAKYYQANFYTNNINDASDHILRIIEPGDTILIKGSNAIGLNRLVNKLKENS